MTTKITRSELAALDLAERMKLMRSKTHTLVDDAPKPKAECPANAISRAHFDSCDPAGKRRLLAEGRVIVDD